MPVPALQAAHGASAMLMTLHTHHHKRESLPPVVSVTGAGEVTGISGYFTAAQLRALARQLNTIANDSDQGETGPATYPVEE